MKNFYYFIFKVVGILLIIISLPLALFSYFFSSLCGFNSPPRCSLQYVPVLFFIILFVIGLVINIFAKRFKK